MQSGIITGWVYEHSLRQMQIKLFVLNEICYLLFDEHSSRNGNSTFKAGLTLQAIVIVRSPTLKFFP